MIIPAHIAHFPLVELTPEGKRELAEVYGMSLQETLRRNLAGSSQAWSMFAGNDLLCMFGVAPVSMLDATGEFWIAGTVNICRHRLSFARQCRRFLPSLMANWTEVQAVFEHGRADILRWALWMGVEVQPVNERLSRMYLHRSA